mgnify:FL=1
MGCRTEKFGAAALLFTFLIETTNGQILKKRPKNSILCLGYKDKFKIYRYFRWFVV